MSSVRHLLYVSDLVPGPGQGGQVILDRHLRRLSAEGWRITVVTAKPIPTSGPWTAVTLPSRRWWWPPFRPRLTLVTRLRTLAWRSELRHLPRPDAVVTVIGGNLSWLAAELAEKHSAPLLAFVHDHWRECGTADDAIVAKHVCRAAAHLLAVSEEMKVSLAADFPTTPVSVLPPIPAAREFPFVGWRDSHATAPIFAHVGALHPYHAPFLEQVARCLAERNGTLLVLCPADNPALAELRVRIPNLRHQPFFPQNRDALAFIAEQASALVVMYPFGSDESVAPPTGFPSRFIEFVQLGLPIVVAAPSRNPLRTWAQRHAWPTQLDPNDAAVLRRTVIHLTERASWESSAAAARSLATAEFDAELIHRRFSQLLAQVSPRANAGL